MHEALSSSPGTNVLQFTYGGSQPNPMNTWGRLTGTFQSHRTRAHLEQMLHQLCRWKQEPGHPRVWGSRGQDTMGGPASGEPPVQVTAP